MNPTFTTNIREYQYMIEKKKFLMQLGKGQMWHSTGLYPLTPAFSYKHE
jgi:hypothetical protein